MASITSLVASSARWFACATLALGAFASSIHAGELWVVSSIAIQPTIDAAADGDVILLAGGPQYNGFVIDGKSLSVVRAEGTIASIVPGAIVRNLAPHQSVLLAGLNLRGNQLLAKPTGFVARDCAGAIRVQDSGLIGDHNAQPVITPPCAFFGDGSGGEGAQIENCADVAFTGSVFIGGMGGPNMCTTGAGLPGGTALVALDSRVALYDCTLEGGRAGATWISGGEGGEACVADCTSFGSLFASGCALTGGQGGLSIGLAGTGGDALHYSGAATLALLDTSLTGGEAGTGELGPGLPGVPYSGLAFTNHPGAARSFALACPLPDATPALLHVSAQPGDFALLGLAASSAHAPFAAFLGTLLLGEPSVLALGFVGPSGERDFDVPIAALPAGLTVLHARLQAAFFSAQGQIVLGGPRAALVLSQI